MADDLRLSVVMVVGAERERARRAVEAVLAQPIGAALELVIVDLQPDRGSLAPTGGGGPQTTVLERPGETSWSAARHAGVAAAQSPIVAFVEDHVYAEPGWANALLTAYRASPDAVAVGYAFANARDDRPDGTLLAEYGRWVVPARGGRWSALPGNNVSYRRDALLGVGGGASSALAVDFTLHAELRRRGPFLVAPAAVVGHEGFPRLSQTLRANHEYGRVLAAARAARGGWTPARRTLYAVGAPVVPLLNAVRLARTLPGRGLWRDVVRHAPACLAIWAAAAAGEVVGYATGSGVEGERLIRWEVDVDRRPR